MAGGELLQALHLACSQNPEELKVGEEKLSAWKREKGFYSELAVSASFRSLDYEAKLSCMPAYVYRACLVIGMWSLESDGWLSPAPRTVLTSSGEWVLPLLLVRRRRR